MVDEFVDGDDQDDEQDCSPNADTNDATNMETPLGEPGDWKMNGSYDNIGLHVACVGL